jgi:DNA-binding response OmpR family regulator/tRNA A-37 threonylcarbamoyl transferase component Bud32
MALEPEAGERASRETPGAALLVVDDNESNRDLLSRRLVAAGYAVATASSGPEALAALSEGRFDVVLLDVMMPEMDGLEVLRRIRDRFGVTELPVVMASALGDTRDLVEALRLGANDYVTKPLDMPVVLARVGTQLALRRASEDVARLAAQLRAAQERISTLLSTGGEAFLDFGRWARSMSEGVAGTLGAGEVSVWLLQEDAFVSVAGSPAPPPSPAAVALLPAGDSLAVAGTRAVAPVRGPRGDLLGAVVADGKAGWDDVERGLLLGFAYQLGGALELQRMKEQLAAARQRSSRLPGTTQALEILYVCPTCARCWGPTVRQCEADGTPLSEPRGLPQRILDRYALTRVLGEGGMGTVFEAFDEKLDRVVAVKVVKPEHFQNATVRRRFVQEANAIAAIRHPNVVDLFDSGDLGDGSMFLVMERLRGRDLSDLIRISGRGTPVQAASLVRQGAAALGAAHRQGIVHRDIKPENVFLCPEGGSFRVRLLDFGLAKRVEADRRLTQSGLIVGTPAWMAPEQISGRDVDERTDVYSFAAVCYLALVGRGVTVETDLDRVFADVVRNPPPLVSTLLRGIPPEVDEAFRRALAKHPGDRPRGVEEWARALASVLERLPARTPGWVFPPPGEVPAGPTAPTLITERPPGPPGS